MVGLDSDLFEGYIFGDESICNVIENISYMKKHVRDVELSDFQGIDVVVHLCALSNDPLGYFNPDMTLEINYQASVKLAKLAKKAGVQRYLFSSSCSVYGASGLDVVTEESKPNAVTPYGISKMRARAMA